MRNGEGRLRLGWRLSLFVALALATIIGVTAVLPPGLLSGSAAMLAAGVISGATLLAIEGRRPGALGFYADWVAVPETAKGVGLGVLVGLVVVGVIAALGGVRWTPQEGTVVAWVTGGFGALVFLALPAAAEESVLRGYPLQALTEAWGSAWALAATSVSFGLLHVWNPGITVLGVVNVAAAGLLIGVVYLKTASLWWATGVHLGWNWSHGYVSDVPVSGLELLDAPFYEGVPQGPDWLGGGAFGPEGSVVATVVLLGAAAVCWQSRWLRPSRAALKAGPLAVMGTERSEGGSSGTGGSGA